MKYFKTILLLITFLAISCSEDNNTNSTNEVTLNSELNGLWKVYYYSLASLPLYDSLIVTDSLVYFHMMYWKGNYQNNIYDGTNIKEKKYIVHLEFKDKNNFSGYFIIDTSYQKNNFTAVKF